MERSEKDIETFIKLFYPDLYPYQYEMLKAYLKKRENLIEKQYVIFKKNMKGTG